MQFPLLNLELIANLKLAHGLFNLTVILFFFYQARNGWLIRRERRTNRPPPLRAVRLHRRLGPLLALLGAGGFASGLILCYLHTGKIILYPAHFTVGAFILLLLLLTYRLSKQLTAAATQQRNLHFSLGLLLLALYLVNAVLGLGLLL